MIHVAGAVAIAVLMHVGGDAAVIDVACKGDAATDAAAINNATAASAIGDCIAIHGRCVVSETVRVLARRAYAGDSRTGTVIIQVLHPLISRTLQKQTSRRTHCCYPWPLTVPC